MDVWRRGASVAIWRSGDALQAWDVEVLMEREKAGNEDAGV